MATATTKKTAKLPVTLRDVVCWFGLRAGIGAILKRLEASGGRLMLAVGRSYPVNLRVTGTANGKAVDERIAGRVTRDANKAVKQAPPARKLVGAAIADRQEPERSALVRRLARRDLDKVADECLKLADKVIAAHKLDGTRAGDVHFEPAAG